MVAQYSSFVVRIMGVLLVLAAGIATLYYLTILAGEVGARIWAVTATVAIPVAVFITAKLSAHWAEEHVSGFHRGLTGAENTITAIGRGLSATASMTRAQARHQPAPDYSDLLPKVGSMQLLDAVSDHGKVDL